VDLRDVPAALRGRVAVIPDHDRVVAARNRHPPALDSRGTDGCARRGAAVVSAHDHTRLKLPPVALALLLSPKTTAVLKLPPVASAVLLFPNATAPLRNPLEVAVLLSPRAMAIENGSDVAVAIPCCASCTPPIDTLKSPRELVEVVVAAAGSAEESA
jgi:hypothetical protein